MLHYADRVDTGLNSRNGDLNGARVNDLWLDALGYHVKA